MPKKISGWKIQVEFTDGEKTWIEDITDMPNDVSQVVDDHLTKLEDEDKEEIL